MNPDIAKFYSQLHQNFKRPMPEALKPLLHESAWPAIFRYFLKLNDGNAAQYSDQHYNDISKQIEQLSVSQGIRFSKEETGLSRTLNLIRDNNGTYYLFLETKSKSKEEVKVEPQRFKGNHKEGKRAYNLSEPGCPPYINFIYHRPDEDTRDLVYLEAEASQRFDPTYISQYVVNDQRDSKGAILKMSLYAKEAQEGDLNSYFQSNFPHLSDRAQNIFLQGTTKQLLSGVQEIHDKGCIHQDIKQTNILVEQTNPLRIKITDFGLLMTPEQLAEKGLDVTTTPDFESPEIVFAYLDPRFNKKDISKYLGYHLCKDQLEPILNSLSTERRPEYDLPHASNDIFALGLVLFSLLKKRYELPITSDDAFVHQHALLTAMLTSCRASRLEIESCQLVFDILEKHDIYRDYTGHIHSSLTSFIQTFDEIIRLTIDNLLKKHPTMKYDQAETHPEVLALVQVRKLQLEHISQNIDTLFLFHLNNLDKVPAIVLSNLNIKFEFPIALYQNFSKHSENCRQLYGNIVDSINESIGNGLLKKSESHYLNKFNLSIGPSQGLLQEAKCRQLYPKISQYLQDEFPVDQDIQKCSDETHLYNKALVHNYLSAKNHQEYLEISQLRVLNHLYDKAAKKFGTLF